VATSCACPSPSTREIVRTGGNFVRRRLLHDITSDALPSRHPMRKPAGGLSVMRRSAVGGECRAPLRVVALVAATLCVGCGGGSRDWTLPNADREGTRTAQGSSIDSRNVSQLRPSWNFTIPIAPRESGVATATPVVAGGVVYLQDMESDV